MTSYALAAAQISTMIIWVGFMLITHAMSKKESAYPPKVSSLLPWFGSAISFAFGPHRFLALCCAQYGPVFKFLLGGRSVIVVGTADSIRNALFTDHRVLANRVEHYSHFRALCGDTSLYPMIFDTLNPQPRLKLYSGGDRVSLRRSLTEPMYCAATPILLGSKFSSDTYDDWVTFLHSFTKRLVQRPFWSLPSTWARGRLLQHITTCLQDKLAGNFAKVIWEKNISFEVASACTFHANQSNVVFWLFSWLMADPRAFSSLRDDIDRAVREEFGSIETPRRLDSPAFGLLNSAILETTRLTTIQSAIRLAECDLQLKDGEGTIPIRKGEYVLLYPRAAQQNEASYPDCHRFVLDRFVQSQYEGDLAPTSGKPYFAFGAGKHVCKGRFLAMFQLKVLTILYLSLFDVTPVPLDRRSSEWEPPQSSARSILTIHPVDDVYVRLRPRTAL
ncbi:cytochrome P450 [Pisolithus sp. B1]|nr:cytochrome P450 [Pisolithus sp. B1]